MDKIKENLKLIFGLVLAIMTGAYFYEKSRRKSAEAIADNKDMLDVLNQLDSRKATNDGQLKSEEIKREEIKKEVEDAKRNSNDTSDADFFNGRKK